MRVRLRQQRLRELIAQSTLSQNHWAIKLGISRGHWSGIVNGKHPYLSPKTRERLLEVFGVCFDDIFEVEPGAGGVDADFQAAIADRYLIEKELGQGGMGTVYLARDVKHGRLVAIKVVSPEAVSGIGTDQFLKEIRYTSRLGHHHILPLHDSGKAADYPFYVMPYIRDGSLRDRLNRDKKLSIADTLTIVRGIAAALHHAHEHQIIHCDVKPENILLSEDHAYVADFGISRVLHREAFEWGKRRDIDTSAGTPAYVSPEQATGEQQLDARSDVYSLGCMVFEMLSGEKPFTGTTTMEVVSKRFRETVPDLKNRSPHIPNALASVVGRAMALDPSERTADAPSLVADLERSAARRPLPAFEAVGRYGSSVWAFLRSVLGLTKKTRRGTAVENVSQDVRYVWRSLTRKPGFFAAAVLTLGLGIGATTAIFSLVYSVLLRPLRYAEAGRVAALQFRAADPATRALWETYGESSRQHHRGHVTYPNFERWRDATGDIFDEVAVYSYTDFFTFRVSFGTESEVLRRSVVSAGLFRALGVQPLLGRLFSNEDDLPEAPGTVILSYGLWQRRFGEGSEAIGRIIHVDGLPHTVIGVMPRGFDFPSADSEFWVPLAWASRRSSSTNYSVVARIKEGISFGRAKSLLEARVIEAEGRLGSTWIHGESLETLRDRVVGDVRPLLSVFLAAVVAVLLIACVNVVNLMLTRASRQEHEHTVRAAIGAGPKRLAQQLLTESTFVSLLGSAVGLCIAFALLNTLVAFIPGSIPRREEIGIDGVALVFTLGVTLLVAVGIGLLPAVRASTIDLAGKLNQGTQGTTRGPRQGRLRDGLVVIQVGLALVLLFCSGVLTRSFLSLLTVETGVRPQNVLAFETTLPRTRYPTFPDRKLFYDQLESEIRALPGVRSAAVVVYLPASGSFNWTEFAVEGYSQASGEELDAEHKQIGIEYFTTMGVSLLEGRAFDGGDDNSGEPVIVINEYMARNYWGQEGAVGGRVMLDDVWHRVVGVVSDVRFRGAGMDVRHPVNGPRIYRPYAAGSYPRGSMDLVVRTDGDPMSLAGSVRRAVAGIDPNVAVSNMRPLEDMLWAAVSEPRFHTLLIGAFGLAALMLSVIGVYGVMSYAVAQQTRELGVRKALGADQGRIVQLVAYRGLAITALGVGLGLLGALGVAGGLEGFLYNVQPRDPWTLVIGVALLGSASMLACLVPAIRASQVDPLVALRME